MDLHKSVARELYLPTECSRAQLYRAIRTEVVRLCTDASLRPLPFIDETAHLRSDVFEELRLLTNYDMDSQNRLCLVGQPILTCGLSLARRSVVAVVADDRGKAIGTAITAAATTERLRRLSSHASRPSMGQAARS